MVTSSTLLRTTRPEYANTSDMLLEVLFNDTKYWAKLKGAEPYEKNRKRSHEDQIKSLEKCRDEWRSNGPKKYYTAQYRIGYYQHQGDGTYAFILAHTLPTETPS